MELIAVIMKAPTSAQRFDDAKVLLSFGFSTYALVKATPDAALPPVPVSLGSQATVQPVAAESSLLLEKAKAAKLEKSVTLVPQAEAPIAKGDVLGTLTVSADGETLAEVSLVAGEDVPRVTWGALALRFLRTAFLGG